MTEPSAVAGAGKILASVPLSTWKEWLAFRFVSDHASVLPKAFDDARFAFYSKELSGVQQQRERWKRGVAAVNGGARRGRRRDLREDALPAVVGAADDELIGNLEDAYRERISSNQWMDEATRKAALEKLAAFEPRIGHPVKYIDYSTMKVVKGDPLGNSLRAARFPMEARAQALSQAGRPDLVGDVPADDQRLLQPAGEPDHLPGCDPAAALLRSQCRCGRQLRRDRRGDRPRDGPRLRQ